MALTEMVIMPGVDYQDACDAVRERTGGAAEIKSGELGSQIRAILSGEDLDDEMDAQDGLIDQITTALVGKSAGTGAENDRSVENSIMDRTVTQYSNATITSIGNSAFRECSSLQTVDIPAVTTIKDSAFDLCYGLNSVNCPAVQSVGGRSFNLCTSLETLDFSVLNTITHSAFTYANKLTEIILRNADAICTLSNTNAFTSTPVASGTGYIYVPSALLDDYKAATNWSDYAEQIRAIEDYPEITGG